MNNRYKLIVFDWDGTLYDSADFIVRSMQRTISDFDLTMPPPEKLRYVIGLSFEHAITYLFPDTPQNMQVDFEKKFREYIYANDNHEPTLFSGVRETLHALQTKNFWLAIATGKSREGLDHDVNFFQVGDYFLTSRCANETQSKPHPQMLLEILDELGAMPAETLMVGDTVFDMELAMNAGVDGLAVTYGVHTQDALHKVATQGVITSIAELPQWLHERKEK